MRERQRQINKHPAVPAVGLSLVSCHQSAQTRCRYMHGISTATVASVWGMGQTVGAVKYQSSSCSSTLRQLNHRNHVTKPRGPWHPVVHGQVFPGDMQATKQQAVWSKDKETEAWRGGDWWCVSAVCRAN